MYLAGVVCGFNQGGMAVCVCVYFVVEMLCLMTDSSVGSPCGTYEPFACGSATEDNVLKKP